MRNGLGAAMQGGQGQIPEAGYGQGQPQPQQQQPAAGGAMQQRQASEEEQAEYNRFVAQTINVLTDEAFMDKAVTLIKQAPTVIEGVARVSASAAGRVYEQAREQGVTVPPNVVLFGGMEILMTVRDMAEASGEEPLDDTETEAAFFMAADMFRKFLDGRGLTDPEGIEQDRQALDQMLEAGELDGVVQDMQAKGQRRKGGDAPAPAEEEGAPQ